MAFIWSFTFENNSKLKMGPNSSYRCGLLIFLFSMCAPLSGKSSIIDISTGVMNYPRSYSRTLPLFPVSGAIVHQAAPPISAATPFSPNEIPRVNAEIYAENLELFIDPFIDVSTTFELISLPSKVSDSRSPNSASPRAPRERNPPSPPQDYPAYRRYYSPRLSLQRQSKTKSPCFRSSCAVRVTISSEKKLRRAVVRAAHRKISQVTGFDLVFVSNQPTKVERRGQKTFVVIVEFDPKYIERMQPALK